ncbi:MAG: GNAT family N-acetyltransferase [Chitinophagaceae bacterium]|nr:GNAT family N-acetyltransferase [Chitinophagaceae bacterium]
MTKIKFQLLQARDEKTFSLIANWYLSEWNIPIEKTIQRLQKVTTADLQFQVIMTLDDLPISTGGLYNHVGLLDKEPGFSIYKNWLALVYTIPKQRQKGYGALICKYIQEHAKKLGLEKMHLFTDTAERLYNGLGWTEVESLQLGDRNVVVMEKNLNNDNNNTI